MTEYERLWLLDLAADVCPQVARVLDQRSAIQEVHHGVVPTHASKLSLFSQLLRLQDDGLIYFMDDAMSFLPEEEQCIRLDREQIKTRIKSDSQAYRLRYGLTAKGGELWENFASPDWDRFWTDVYPNDHSIEIECSSPAVWQSIQPHICGFLRIRFGRIVSSDVLTNWRATYWKTLAEGFRLTAAMTDDFDNQLDPNARKWRALGFNRLECERIVQRYE